MCWSLLIKIKYSLVIQNNRNNGNEIPKKKRYFWDLKSEILINRSIEPLFKKRLKDNKAIILLGARQVGKTTFLNSFFTSAKKTLFLNGDNIDHRNQFENINLERWKILLAHVDILIINEAQRIADIGIKIKLVLDNLSTKVILAGSSALELANSFNEPLTGRKWEIQVFPLSFEELKNHLDVISEIQLLNHRLTFGSYPEVVNHPGDEVDILSQLVDSYLYKDIFTWQGIKKPDKKLTLSMIVMVF